MTAALLDTIPQIVLVVGAAVVLVVAVSLPRGRQWVTAPIALLTLAGSAAAALTQAGIEAHFGR